MISSICTAMNFACQTQLICLAFCVFATPIWMTKIKLSGFQCQNMDPKFGIIQQCIIKAYSREIKELNLYIKLLRVPLSNVTVYGPIIWLYLCLHTYYITDWFHCSCIPKWSVALGPHSPCTTLMGADFWKAKSEIHLPRPFTISCTWASTQT